MAAGYRMRCEDAEREVWGSQAIATMSGWCGCWCLEGFLVPEQEGASRQAVPLRKAHNPEPLLMWLLPPDLQHQLNLITVGRLLSSQVTLS